MSATQQFVGSPSKSGSALVERLPPASPTANTLRVVLPNGGFNVVKYGNLTRVRVSASMI